jgi:hypothetical protein
LAEDRENRIRDRAYKIWQDEGEPEGRDQAHWAQAEQEHGDDEAAGGEPGGSADDGLISDVSEDLPFGEPADTGTEDEALAADSAPDHPQTSAAEPTGSGTAEPAAPENTPAAIDPPAAASLGKKQPRGKARTKTTN